MIVTISLSLVAFLLLVIVFCSYRVSSVTDHKTFNTIDDVPSRRIGLVLVTSKYLKNGEINPYFQNRINAAAALYHAGKIERLVLSGDHGSKYYNEPEDMKNALLLKGVSPKHIYLDYAGFRTLDSIVRVNAVFNQKIFTVISQEFHNKRAIFIGRNLGMDLIGYNAEHVTLSKGVKVQIREALARVKVFIDLLLNVQPKYLGEPIEIE